jgi:hypothetical protein
MLDNCGMDDENYSKTLIGWANYVDGNADEPDNVTLGAASLQYNDTVYGGSPYDDGEEARDYLTGATVNWVITDAGKI